MIICVNTGKGHLLALLSSSAIPAGTWRQNDVRSTSMRRHDVSSTLIWCHYDVMCPLGCEAFGQVLFTIINPAFLQLAHLKQSDQQKQINISGKPVGWKKSTQRAHDVMMASYQRLCDVMASHRRQYDVIMTSCACWETTPAELTVPESHLRPFNKHCKEYNQNWLT